MTELRDQFVVEVDTPEDTKAVINSDFESAAKKVWIGNWSGNVDNPLIDSELYTTDLGEHQKTEGSPIGQTVGFRTYAEGLQVAAGDGETPVRTGLTAFIEAFCGQAATFADGDTTAGTPTTSAIDHSVGPTYAVNQILGFVLDDGTIECRPVLAYSNPTITPAIKLSAAPSAANVIQGSANVSWSDSPSAFRTCQFQRLGNDGPQQKTILGAAMNMALPATDPTGVQYLDWTAVYAAYSDYPGSPNTRADPTAYTPRNAIGSQFLIAPYHASAAQDFMYCRFGGVSFDGGAQYQPIFDQPNLATGFQDWKRTRGTRLASGVILPHDSDPSAAAAPGGAGNGMGLTATNWRALRRNLTENRFQLFFQLGRVAGNILCIWMRDVRVGIIEPTTVGTDMDGIAVNFYRSAGATAPPLVISQL